MSKLDDIKTAQDNLEEFFIRKMDELESQIQGAGPAKGTNSKYAEEFRTFREIMFSMMGILRRQISQCSKTTDAVDTWQRRKALIFYGVPETDKENCTAVIQGILNSNMALKDMTSQSIKICHRLGGSKEGRQRPILVRFADVTLKAAVWKMKSTLKGSSVTVREFLTKSRQATFAKARSHFGVRSSWTQDGVIVVKTSDGTRYKVTSLDELQPIIAKHPKVAANASSTHSGVVGVGSTKNTRRN